MLLEQSLDLILSGPFADWSFPPGPLLLVGSDQTATPAVAKAFQVAQATTLGLWVVKMTKFPSWFADFNPKTTGLVADFWGVPASENWDEDQKARNSSEAYPSCI